MSISPPRGDRSRRDDVDRPPSVGVAVVLRRLFFWAVGSLAVLFLGWLVLANTLLMTSLGPSLASSAHVRTTWEHGWSTLPGRVHVRGLQVAVLSNDEDSSWRIDAREADATLSPLTLLAGAVHAHSARMAHVAIVVEGGAAPPMRDVVDGATRAKAAPIALVRRGGRGESEGADVPAAALVVERLEAVDVHSVRVGPLVFGGAAVVSAGFSVTPSGATRIDHASIDPRGGDARWASFALSNIEGHLRLTSAPPVPSVGAGRPLVGDGELVLDAVIQVDGTRDGDSPPGIAHASLSVVEGALAPGGTASVRIPAGDAPSTSALDGLLSVAEDGHARGTIAVRGLGWPPTNDDARVIADEATLTFSSPRVAVDAPFANSVLVLDVTRGHAEPARLPLIGPLVRDHAETLEGTAHVVFADGVGSGVVHAHSDALPLALGAATLRGPLDLETRIRSLSPTNAEARLDIDVTHGSGTTLTVRDAVAVVGDHPVLQGSMTIHFDDSAPLLEALAGRAQLPALVLALAGARPFDASAELRADADRVELADIVGNVGFVGVRGRWARDSGPPSTKNAVLLLEAGPLATGIAVDGATTTLVLADARAWFDGHVRQ